MKVQLLIGSTRPTRISPTIANWIVENVPKHDGIDFEIIDIKTWDLPLFDEPLHPAMHEYKHDYTKAWSEKISQADGYIFLTSEYNAGYPASLKNAIDYLYHEWTAKPVMVASYGAGGGGGANAQLIQVVERLKMVPTKTNPDFILGKEMSNEDGQLKDIKTDFEPYVAKLQEGLSDLIELVKSADAQK